MRSVRSLALTFAVTALLAMLTACGSVAAPPPLATNTPQPPTPTTARVAAESTTAQVVTEAPTATVAPPTATPEPPTATATPEVVAAEPTEEVAAAVDPAAADASDPVSLLVSFANPARGDELFHTEYNTSAGPYMCVTCHNVETDNAGIGPGMASMGVRAATRVEGQSAAEYIYNSIIHPDDYIVEGFGDNLMPENYRDLLTDTDLYDITAYLLTLQGGQ